MDKGFSLISTENSFPTRRLRISIGLWIFCFSIYVLTTGGHDYTVDGAQSYYTAENIALRHTLAIDKEGPANDALKSADGHFYSKYGPGLAAAELPFLVTLWGLTEALPMEAGDRSIMLRAWVPIVTNATITAALVALIYSAILQLGYSNAVGIAVSLLAAFSTPLWVYARLDFSEPLQSILLFYAFFLVCRVSPAASTKGSLSVGAAFGALILTKSFFIVLAPVFWVALLWKLRAHTLRVFILVSTSYGALVVLASVAYAGLNFVRYGSPFEFGYTEGFDTPLLVGLYGWFFSSGKSVFLYAPILILLLSAFPLFAKRHRFEAVLILAITVPTIVFYAKFWSWHGDWAWSLRYAVPLISFWVLPIATLALLQSKIWRVPIVIFGAAGVIVQLLGISINAPNYISIITRQLLPILHPGQGDDVYMNESQLDIHFIPEFSPLAGHWWLLKAAIEKRIWDEPPEKNVALNAYPWLGRSERVGWRPAHPEYAAVIDIWPADPPKYMSGFWIAMLTITLSCTGIIGLALIVFGFKSSGGRWVSVRPKSS